MIEPEIVAISKSYELFKPLEDDFKIQLIQWFISKFKLDTSRTYANKLDQGSSAAYLTETIKQLSIENNKSRIY